MGGDGVVGGGGPRAEQDDEKVALWGVEGAGDEEGLLSHRQP